MLALSDMIEETETKCYLEKEKKKRVILAIYDGRLVRIMYKKGLMNLDCTKDCKNLH